MIDAYQARTLAEMISDPRPIAGGDGEGEGQGDGSGDGSSGGAAQGQAGGAGDPGTGGDQGAGRSSEEIEADLARTRREAKARREENEALQKKVKDLEDRDKSETDKARQQAAEAQQRAEAAERRAAEREIRYTIESAARDLHSVDPEAVVRFLAGEIEPDGKGNVDRGEVEKAVKALLKRKPYLAPAGSNGGGGSAGSPANPDRRMTPQTEPHAFGMGRIRRALSGSPDK